MSTHDDLLTEDQLSRVTGVDKSARNRDAKMAEILDKAGIFHWWKHSGGIATTWHHVHNARPRVAHNDSSIPNFGAIR